ncbi:MAG: pyruvate kinase [Oscillospiraceae bacterium]
MRKTKIVCTLGLVSQTADVIGQLMDAGMNVARFNFSHGTHESHKKMLDIVKKLRKKKNIPVAALLDTKGPEIRLGLFKDGKALLTAGSIFTLYPNEREGDSTGASISFPGLADDLEPGNTILLDDGLIELRVKSIENGVIACEVINGGEISNRKGVNIPGVSTSLPYISDRDREDILFGIEQDFDFVAASFVRSAADVIELRELLGANGGKSIRIISKIENADGVQNIDEILRASDGIMVARGDMGVEIPFEELPPLQKMLIEKAYKAGKMVITATQMLESMIKNPRPTRAEVTDVANAVYDGTSAIMLSGETAAGLYPVKAVEAMARVAEKAENDINYLKRFHNTESGLDNTNVTNAISHATCTTAYDLSAAAIIAVTLSGRSARNVSKFRPDIPIIGCTTSEKAYRQMVLSWGVTPVMIPMQEDLNELFNLAVGSAMEQGYVKDGDLVVITTGVPLGVAGTTNLLKVHIAGNVLVNGHGIGDLKVRGRLCVVKSEEEALEKFHDGDILVIPHTTNALLSILKRASGIVCEEDGTQSHAAIVGLTLDIPVLVGAANATNVLKTGTFVLLDAQRGVVCSASY